MITSTLQLVLATLLHAAPGQVQAVHDHANATCELAWVQQRSEPTDFLMAAAEGFEERDDRSARKLATTEREHARLTVGATRSFDRTRETSNGVRLLLSNRSRGPPAS